MFIQGEEKKKRNGKVPLIVAKVAAIMRLSESKTNKHEADSKRNRQKKEKNEAKRKK